MNRSVKNSIVAGSIGLVFVLGIALIKGKARVDVAGLSASIQKSTDFEELDGYYSQINGMLSAGKITYQEYMTLYDSYVERFYNLLGVKA